MPHPGRFIPGKNPVPIVQEAGWTPGPVWTGAKNLAYFTIPSPGSPAHNECLYWLSYPSPWIQPTNTQINKSHPFFSGGGGSLWQFTCTNLNILTVTNPDSTNKSTFLLLCIALLIISYMFQINCYHHVADNILLKPTARKWSYNVCAYQF
jgi:hypothetical protein